MTAGNVACMQASPAAQVVLTMGTVGEKKACCGYSSYSCLSRVVQGKVIESYWYSSANDGSGPLL
jgi:hypothetical protein